MNKIVFATNNANKLREAAEILAPLGIEVISQREAGADCEPEENGVTFAENAMIKAKAVFDIVKIPVFADDSGLCVDALDGRPGVYSARYAGENSTDEEKYLKLLDEMKDVPKEKRTAHFTSSICCILPNGEKIQVEGKCNGEIAFEPYGDGGFGYDPVFFVNGKSYAQISAQEKDAISHRGQALRMLKAELEKYFENNPKG